MLIADLALKEITTGDKKKKRAVEKDDQKDFLNDEEDEFA